MKTTITQTEIISRFLLLFILVTSVLAQEAKIGDHGDGSRAVPVHQIKLIDEDSSVVRTDDRPMLPFSTKHTCGSCHDYQKIRTGWHFNAGDSGAVSGRPGHPWILADQNSGTQIPVSLRGWPGTFRPEDLGLNGLEYLQLFARQMPGGSIGDNENLRNVEQIFRWRVSGDLEINCLSCHDAESGHDQAAYAANTSKQNFRWAATSSAAFANGYGSAREMPDNFDIYLGLAPDLPKVIPPHVVYDPNRFNDHDELQMDIVRQVPDRNCYYCHSNKIISQDKKERWQHDNDVHISAGLGCVDCHRNGLDHDMSRGYGNQETGMDPDKSDLTCAGCHLESGRLGAPKPLHLGLPQVHLEKMTCTTCHSGPLPAAQTGYVKTSMGHALGVHGTSRADSTLPHIYSPVFVAGENGQIAPHNLIWPAYWGFMKADTIVPVPVKQLGPYLTPLVTNDDSTGAGNWLAFADSDMIAMLDTLSILASDGWKPVYLAGGRIYSLENDSSLVSDTDPAAKPYHWAIGHDVRPATQSLGINGCQDCHSVSSQFYYGSVNADSPVLQAPAVNIENIDYMNVSRAGTWIFSSSFLFRPWLKIFMIALTFILIMVLLIYIVKALSVITEGAGK